MIASSGNEEDSPSIPKTRSRLLLFGQEHPHCVTAGERNITNPGLGEVYCWDLSRTRLALSVVVV